MSYRLGFVKENERATWLLQRLVPTYRIITVLLVIVSAYHGEYGHVYVLGTFH
jgi:uncharacterized membrane protein